MATETASSRTVEAVRSKRHGGGLVKQKHDRWYEVGDATAREKVGHIFHEQLYSKYKSSTKAKRRKKKLYAKVSSHLEHVLSTNNFMAIKIDILANTIEVAVECLP